MASATASVTTSATTTSTLTTTSAPGEQADVVVLDDEAEPPSMSGPKPFF
jgi:hypothetical protein